MYLMHSLHILIGLDLHFKTLIKFNREIKKVKNLIKPKFNPKKAPGYDIITGKVLKELSENGNITFI